MLGYLFLPIAVVAALSFNQPSSRLSYDFNQFTLDNWTNVCGPAGLCAAVVAVDPDRVRLDGAAPRSSAR